MSLWGEDTLQFMMHMSSSFLSYGVCEKDA
jgi:hypothetical protein